jgi:hypothetical protein
VRGDNNPHLVPEKVIRIVDYWEDNTTAAAFVGNSVARAWVLREGNIPVVRVVSVVSVVRVVRVATQDETRNHSLNWNCFRRFLQGDTVQSDTRSDRLNLCSHEDQRGSLGVPGAGAGNCRRSRRMSDGTIAVDKNIDDLSWMSLVAWP